MKSSTKFLLTVGNEAAEPVATVPSVAAVPNVASNKTLGPAAVPSVAAIPTVPTVPTVASNSADVASNRPVVARSSAPDVARNIATPRSPSVPTVASNNTSTARVARSREARNISQLNVGINADLAEWLRVEVKRRRMTIAEWIEQTIYREMVATAPSVASNFNVASAASNVSMMNDEDAAGFTEPHGFTETHNIFSHQYAEILGRTLSETDRQAIAQFVREYGPADEHTVQIGMATCLLRTKHPKINGVRYFFQEILLARELPEASRKEMAEFRMLRLKRERSGK